MKRILDPALTVVCLGLLLTATSGFGYPALGPETPLAICAALVLAVVLTISTARFPALRMTVLGYLFLSLVVPAFVSGYLPARLAVIAGAATLGLLHQRLQPHFFLAFALVFAPLKYYQDIRFSASDHQASAPAADIGAPTEILVHLVMDEMGSFGSVPGALRNESEENEIRAAYEKRGFRIHSGAPSISWESKDSLGTLVDLGWATGGLANVEQVEGQYAFRVMRNRLHGLFAASGWTVSIVQSSYLDFCRDPKWNCRTYQPGRNAHLFAGTGIPMEERLAILKTLLIAALSGIPEPWRSTPDMPLSSLTEMDVLGKRAQTAHGKQYFFGHFLVPHFPWTVDRNCRVRPQADWRAPDLSGESEGAGYHASMTRAYWHQAYCAHRKVLQTVDALDAAHPGKVRFMVHGDHGPRIIRKVLPPGEDDQVGDHARSMLEPFIASRLASEASLGPADTVTMQALIQKLLMAEAAVPTSANPVPGSSKVAAPETRP
jgi:hypothetical protein